jgi:hypothetical protein
MMLRLEKRPSMANNPPPKNDDNSSGIFSRLMDTLVGMGLGETILRAGTTILSVILLGAVVWLLRLFYLQQPEAVNVANALQTGPTAPVSGINNVSQQEAGNAFGGIPRLAQVHTTIPSRPRDEVVKYTVQEGDTVFGIAEKFGLEPETVLWGNYYTLLDDPHQ